MKRRILIFAVLLCMICTALPGCGKMTGQKLVTKMVQALTERPMTQTAVQARLDMSAGVETFGITVETDLGVQCRMDTVVSSDPYLAYGKGELGLTMTLFGKDIDLKETLEVYSETEDGQLICKTHTGKTNFWLEHRIALPEMDEQLQQTIEKIPAFSYGFLAQKLAGELILEEETALLNDREVYVLRCTLSGQEVQQILSTAGYANALAQLGLEDVDLTVLEIPAVFYVNTDTFLPAKIDLEIQGTEEMVAPLVDKLLEGSGFDLNVTIRTVEISLSDIGFEPVQVPRMPAVD